MSLVEYKGIISFSIYKELLPITKEILNTIISLEKNQEYKDYNFIFKETKEDLLNILNNLSKGYNKFFPKQKSIFYNLSRDNLSNIQSNILFLNELNILSKEKSINYYNNLENKIKMFNGLIRKIETKEEIYAK